MNRILFAALGLLGISSVAATPLERDLGQGLAYYRIHELPADAPVSLKRRTQPLVVDVRYARAEDDAVATFQSWLKVQAAPRTPVFVLANAQTAPGLRRVLADEDPLPGVIVIGIAAPDFQPDVVVKASAEKERAAYDALEQGGAVAALLVENPDKVRNDEASLSKERPAEGAADPAATAAKSRATPPPLDSVLQRAVHLHRALVALKKL